MPIISVVVPAYNAEHTILETVDSVLKQTFTDFELIVIDDGSTDQTAKLLQSIADPRLKVFSYPNGSASVARNRGMAHATGDYISFLDADDLWTADKLQAQLAALQAHPEAGVAYSWTCNMSPTGEAFYPGVCVTYAGNVQAQLLLSNFLASGSNCLIRRDAITSVGAFDPTLEAYEDWDYYLRLAARWPFVGVPKYQILYRQSAGGRSSKIAILEKYSQIVIERAFCTAPPKLQPLKKQSLAINYQYLAGLCLAYADHPERMLQAGEKLWQAIRAFPPILLDKHTQRYAIKWLMMRLFSPQLATRFTRPVGKANRIADPRLHPPILKL
jgi:glycosyltransferase involved in cell wall biosynthesis